MTNLIAAAVAPLKEIQMDYAASRVLARCEKVFAELAAVNWDVSAYLGVQPNFSNQYPAYKEWKAKQSFVSMITNRGEGWPVSQRVNTIYVLPVVRNDAKVEEMVQNARAMAAASYEAYVAKMIAKIGDVTEASMCTSSHVWGYSVLEVTTVAGERQVWTTQQIVNCSVHGKLFNQWPSRLAASKASQKKAMKALAA
jgi:hypothetical protein